MYWTFLITCKILLHRQFLGDGKVEQDPFPFVVVCVCNDPRQIIICFYRAKYVKEID